MRTLRKIAFLIEEFVTASPAQHLLDRFLIGYSLHGSFHRIPDLELSVYLIVSSESDFGSRREDFQLRIEPTAEQAVAHADAVVIVPRRPGAVANEAFLSAALRNAPEGSACFVYGALANSLASARQFIALAASRKIAVLAGTPISVTWRLPAIDVTPGTPLSEALIVVQVSALAAQASPPFPPASLRGAELHALEGLLPVIERRRGGETGVRSIRFLEGKDLWRAGDKGVWSQALLASALSRSHTPQGHALLDGRTEDLAGLGLVPKLARNPRGWLLEHRDGLRSAILFLDGVVADFNFAVRTLDGSVISAQLLRGAPPAEHHFSRLTGIVEDFFQTGTAPWRIERNLLIAGLLEAFAKPASLLGQSVRTDELSVTYQPRIPAADLLPTKP